MKLKILMFALIHFSSVVSSERNPSPDIPKRQDSIIDRAIVSCEIPYDATEEEMKTFRETGKVERFYLTNLTEEPKK